MTAPRVSVILCGYNQGSYLRQAVDSVLAQTCKDFELIIIDNGSSDDSKNILESYASHPSVKLLLHKENGFLTRRHNEAILQASGEFISFLYADDYYLPEKLERQLACFETLSPEYDIVYGPGYRVNLITGEKWVPPGLALSGSVLEAMLGGAGSVNPISPLIRRECLLSTPFYEEIFNEGEGIFVRLAVKSKFHYLDQPLVVMQEHLANYGKSIKINRDCLLFWFDKLEHDPGFPPRLLRDLRKHRAVNLMNFGWQGIRVAEDPVWARDCFRRAFRSRPAQVLHPRMLAGLLLSLLPGPVMGLLNWGANAMSRQKDNIAFKKDLKN